MPVVLATAEGKPRSGYTYDDRTGISYEYPKQYAKLVTPGEPFVYHIAGRGYIGAGIVGEVYSSLAAGRLVCEILDYEPFDEAVPLRGPDGFYYEAKPDEGKLNVYWAKGVRPISTSSYEQIVWSGPPANAKGFEGVSGYASPEVAVLIESISMQRAEDWLKTQYPNETIVRMPHNNPGYDIRVGSSDAPTRFVEVKGTQSAKPVFWLSEGERKFSIANADRYDLIVISGINLKAKAEAVVTVRAGGLEGEGVELEPSQWRGSISVPFSA